MFRSMALFLFAVALAIGADVSGTWDMTVETELGAGRPTFVLKQDGDKISGTYNGQLGEAKVAGTVKGEAIEFSFEVSPGGDKIAVKYSGKLDGATRMKGEIDFGGLGKGTFTGQKK